MAVGLELGARLLDIEDVVTINAVADPEFAASFGEQNKDRDKRKRRAG